MTQGSMSGLQATAERINALFADMNRLPKRHAETTIFNIGGRGYYENATSDVLAFFLDPSREHGFKTAILESLLSAAGINGSDFEPLNRPEREYPSSGGNRIDILVEGKNHVLVIENKIRHAAVNPFEDYEQTIRDKFRGKKALLVLLTYRDEQVPGWSTARYQIVVNHLRERMGHLLMDRAYTKWPLLLREFVLTLEEEMADEELEQALLEFGTKNAAPLFEARDLLNKFVNQVAEQALSVVAAECGVAINKCATRFHSWSDGQAIRLLVPADSTLKCNA
jgi:hypothetical protein